MGKTVKKSLEKIKKITPEYLKGLTTYWDLGIFFALGVVLLILPVGIVMPHAPVPSEIWIDLVLTPLFFSDYWKSRASRSDESRGIRNRVFQVLSILPLQSFFQLTGIAFLWLPILQGFRLFRTPLLYTRLKRRSHGQLIQKKLKLGMVAFCCVIIVHWIACTWVFLNPSESLDSVTVYNEALYWAITTLTTVGYGDVTPSTNAARVFTMFIMVLGVGFYGLIIGQVSRMMLESDKRKEETREKLQALTSLLKHYDVPANIQDEAFQFYQHLLNKQISDQEERVLEDLPKALQIELQIYMNMKPLANVVMFSHVSSQCLKEVAKNLEQVFFSPDDVIIRKGELGDTMFVIGHGKVKVHVGDNHIAELSHGQCFGEMALIGDSERQADVTATSYCDLFTLSKASFEELMKNHPDLRKNVGKIVDGREKENAKKISGRRASDNLKKTG